MDKLNQPLEAWELGAQLPFSNKNLFYFPLLVLKGLFFFSTTGPSAFLLGSKNLTFWTPKKYEELEKENSELRSSARLSEVAAEQQARSRVELRGTSSGVELSWWLKGHPGMWLKSGSKVGCGSKVVPLFGYPIDLNPV